jgi:hypothetical protein
LLPDIGNAQIRGNPWLRRNGLENWMAAQMEEALKPATVKGFGGG